MIIFINDNRRNKEFRFCKKKGEGMQMIIPSNVSNKGEVTRLKFDKIEKIKDVNDDIELHGYNVCVEENIFICQKDKEYVHDKDTETFISILNAQSVEFGDILIKENLKSKITLLKCIENIMPGSDHSRFWSFKYIIKFEISKNEQITIYKGNKFTHKPSQAMTFKWDDTKGQFSCITKKPEKPLAKDLVPMCDLLA